jgi:hypothetical protein
MAADHGERALVRAAYQDHLDTLAAEDPYGLLREAERLVSEHDELRAENGRLRRNDAVLREALARACEDGWADGAGAFDYYAKQAEAAADHGEIGVPDEAVELVRRAVKMFRTTYGSKAAFASRAKVWTDDAERFLASVTASQGGPNGE